MIKQVNLSRHALFAAAIAAILCFGDARAAMIINSFNTPATESFNSFDGTHAAIPANFSWSADAVTDVERGLFNPATQAYNNNNGLYALYFSPTNDSSDRAFGTKRQPNSTPAILTWTFQNQTGSDIPNFTVSWDVEQYTAGGRPTAIDLDYNPNGAGNTQAGIIGTSLTTAATGTPTSGANLASPIITSRSVLVALATPLANGQSIDFRWSTTGNTVGGANAHIGVDNVSVTAVPEPPTQWLVASIAATVGLSRVWSRRRMSLAFVNAGTAK
jgi:hypothetical protein